MSAREWMRICFELLELLKAHKKAIRRATVNTFGYIAKAIGPHDVLATLLNNLKVQERQNRVCTTVAIAIVAETCSPFTVLPGLMNEYRVPELNVQNGVLKSLSFLFEYIGEMGKVRSANILVKPNILSSTFYISAGLHIRGNATVRGRIDGQGPGAPSDRLRRHQAHGARSVWLWLRGRSYSPHELRLAKRLRNLPASRTGVHGCHRR